jgi:hypothetical protein
MNQDSSVFARFLIGNQRLGRLNLFKRMLCYTLQNIHEFAQFLTIFIHELADAVTKTTFSTNSRQRYFVSRNAVNVANTHKQIISQ